MLECTRKLHFLMMMSNTININLRTYTVTKIDFKLKKKEKVARSLLYKVLQDDDNYYYDNDIFKLLLFF